MTGQLTREDLDDIRATRREFMAVRAVPVEVLARVVAGTDEHFGTPEYTHQRVVVSGVVLEIEERDRLLRLGGRIRQGDLKLVLHNEDGEQIGLDRLRDSTLVISGARYLSDVVSVQGIGIPNRVEIGLVLE